MITLPELVAAADKRRPALLSRHLPPVTYHDLAMRMERTVQMLRSRGVSRGQRVAAVLPNGPDLAAAFLSVSAGAAFAPLNPGYQRAELRFYLEDIQPAALITEPGYCTAAEEAARELGVPLLDINAAAASAAPVEFAMPGDTALLLHSSGTTARPKLVGLTHRNLALNAFHIARSLALTTEDRCLNVMPLFHIHGLVGALLSSLAAGASVFCSPGFNVFQFQAWLKESAATWYSAVPSMHQAVLSRKTQRPAGQLRMIRSSSAHLHTRVWQELESQFGCPALNCYGMTEASHQIAADPLPPGRRRFETVGLSAGPDIAILDGAGRELQAGATGEIALRGETIIAAYVSPAAANETAFARGWFRTGDEGRMDEEGYLTITGRLKEIINCGGEKISPAEIDGVLMLHSAVSSAVAFGAPCPVRGERVYAAVVLEPGSEADERELKHFLGDRLASFKLPSRILIVPEIPKGPTGKMQRIGLAQRLGIS